MKIIVLAAGIAVLASSAWAFDVYHRGYTTGNGTWVAPHYQTPPDGRLGNNYGTQGNMNPWTGQPGTRPAYPQGTWMAPKPLPGWR